MRETESLAKDIRKKALHMVYRAGAPHIGSCLSAADLLAVLYGKIVNVDPHNMAWPDRDRVIVSKGHAAAIVYSVLAECGFFPEDWLETYCEDGSLLMGHVSHLVPGVEVSTGSLGHGLSIGCGLALAGKRDRRPYRVFVILSDGELDEGSTWEAILFAPVHRLDNMVAIVDYNKIQGFGMVKDVLDLEPLTDKWRSCKWAVREVDGHDHDELNEVLACVPFERGKPSALIAHTVKGKGVSFMEDNIDWHYKSPTKKQLEKALEELEQK